MLLGMLMSDCNHPATAQIAQHHPHTYSVSTTVSLWCDACDVSMTPGPGVATRAGQASLLVVSRAVKEGLVAFSKLTPAQSHQLQLKNPQHHPYPPRTHNSCCGGDSCDVSMTPAISSYTHGPSFFLGGE